MKRFFWLLILAVFFNLILIRCNPLEDNEGSKASYSIGELINQNGFESTVERVFYKRTSYGDISIDSQTGAKIIVAQVKFTNGTARSEYVSPSNIFLINGNTQCDDVNYSNTPYDPEGNIFIQNESKTIISGVTHIMYVVFEGKTGLTENIFKIVKDRTYPFIVTFEAGDIQ